METIKITEKDRVFIYNDDNDGIGCGTINRDGFLYYIDKNKGEAKRLPEKYKDTPIYIYHPCGGYQEGLIMVSLLGEIKLQYHHDFRETAGIWGWIDLDGNEVIPPQYVYAMSFFDGRAIVCKGDWDIDKDNRYWCNNEQWGIIDKSGKEIVPCVFDEIYDIENTDRYILCHKGGWKSGNNCIFDIDTGEVLIDLDFAFDNGYMFNECFFENDCIYFDEHIPGESLDYIYVYSIAEKKWIAYKEQYEERELNGQTKVVVNKDGKDIIVF